MKRYSWHLRYLTLGDLGRKIKFNLISWWYCEIPDEDLYKEAYEDTQAAYEQECRINAALVNKTKNKLSIH